MTTHELKIHREHFTEVLSGEKKAEIRKNDRDCEVGDQLNLNEYLWGVATGRGCSVLITHILDNKEYLQDGFVMLSFEPLFDVNRGD